MMKLLLISATAMVLAAPALAQVTAPSAPVQLPSADQPITPPTPSTPSVSAEGSAKVDVFAKLDTDKNGAITIAELKAADATATQADFNKYDADKSKSLSKAE